MPFPFYRDRRANCAVIHAHRGGSLCFPRNAHGLIFRVRILLALRQVHHVNRAHPRRIHGRFPIFSRWKLWFWKYGFVLSCVFHDALPMPHTSTPNLRSQDAGFLGSVVNSHDFASLLPPPEVPAFQDKRRSPAHRRVNHGKDQVAMGQNLCLHVGADEHPLVPPILMFTAF